MNTWLAAIFYEINFAFFVLFYDFYPQLQGANTTSANPANQSQSTDDNQLQQSSGASNNKTTAELTSPQSSQQQQKSASGAQQPVALTAEQQRQNSIEQSNKKLEIESKLAAIQRELSQKTSGKKQAQRAKGDLGKAAKAAAALAGVALASAKADEGKRKDMKSLSDTSSGEDSSSDSDDNSDDSSDSSSSSSSSSDSDSESESKKSKANNLLGDTLAAPSAVFNSKSFSKVSVWEEARTLGDHVFVEIRELRYLFESYKSWVSFFDAQ